MNVLCLQTYANDATEKAIASLGHGVRMVNYHIAPIPTDPQPDLVIVHMGDMADCRTTLDVALLRQFKERGARLVWWTYDPPCYKRPVYSHLALACDEIIVCTADDLAFFGAQHPRVRIDYCGIDPAHWLPTPLHWREQKCYGADLSLVGHLYTERLAAVRRLRELGFDLSVWPDDGFWLDHDRVRYAYQASAINIISPISWTGKLDAEYLICRHFEIPAVGAFALAWHNDAVRRHFPSIPTYTDLDDLVEKCRYFLAQPDLRKQSADAARAAVLAHWTLARFFAEIIRGQ